MEIKTVDIDKLRPFEGNPKRHPQNQIDKIIRSFSEFGWTNPCLVTKDNMIVAGHARVEAARKAKIKEIPVIYLPFDGKKALAYAVADNKLAELAEWDFTKMADLMTELDDGEFDLELTGFDMEEIEEIMNWTPGDDGKDIIHKKLTECFIVPPFSVLDTRQGYWQERKQAWLSLGIQSELGRGGD